MLKGTLAKSLRTALGNEQVLNSLTARYAFANDAGPYLLIPELVLQPRTEADIQTIFRLAHQHRKPVVFRAGGTSLSGQSITDGWLVDIARYWRSVEPNEDGSKVCVQPGAIGGMVNARLKPFGRKIGPDPSSINSAMIGGMLSNNSSGMCCGVKLNAYHTLQSIRFILPDGSLWDTREPDLHETFTIRQSNLATGIISLRDQLRSSEKLADRIREKYKQKNTVGYGLNAFLDFEHPLDILAHLLIGAEGTLAFISEATLTTVPELPSKATALAYFSDVLTACASIPILIDAGCEAIEIMDYASLLSIRNLEGVPIELAAVLNEHPGVMGILFEFQAATSEELDAQLSRFHDTVENRLVTVSPIRVTRNAKEQAYLWKLRKGMYPAVAAVRARGEAAILEDIAVPVEKLGPAILDLQSLFEKHAYENGIIFGHAKDGNLHFVITQGLHEQQDIDKYARFIDDMVSLVVHKYDGALKAEHGTGRNMTPFVETEWGTEAVAIMRQLKSLVDPQYILNPDVILTSRPSLHTCDLKALPVVEDIVDKCIECGACEPRCPSRDFTLSPRQRIVIRRAMSRLTSSGENATAKQLEKEYVHAGLASCATDGLCSIDCPVAINTGDLVKQLRRERTRRIDTFVANLLAKHFSIAEGIVKSALHLGMIVNRVLGAGAMTQISTVLKRFLPSVPLWHRSLNTESLPQNFVSNEEADFLYLPACLSRMMGGTAQTLLRVSQRAGIRIHLSNGSHGLCCGQAFSSKGYTDTAIGKQCEWINYLWTLSREGNLPIVVDLGSCSAFLRQSPLPLPSDVRDKRNKLRILDSIEFAHEFVLPALSIKRKLPSVAVHSVCSNQKTGWEEPLIAVAQACADHIIQPHAGKCCGMGGDRGFALPGLTNTATEEVRSAMQKAGCNHGFTSARSCAIALATSSGFEWESVFHLLDAVSKAFEND
jgi:D-lactate dehydrogenase